MRDPSKWHIDFRKNKILEYGALFMKTLLFSLFFPLIIYAKPLQVSVDAESAILINAKSGRILFEKDAYEKKYPGSITKLVTAIYALEKNSRNFEEIVTPSNDALLVMMADEKQKDFFKYPSYRLEHDGTMMRLKKGQAISIRALFHGMMLVSGNDAANAVAEAYSDSIDEFVEEMNNYMQSIGCTNTYFTNPHGLHHPHHVTTAYDLSIISKRALTHTVFRQLASTKKYSDSYANLSNHNRLLNPSNKYFYPHAIGIKTGYHARAKNTLLAAANKDDRELIAVLLACSTRVSRYEDAIRLFEAAYSETKECKTILKKEKAYSKEIMGAKSSLSASLRKDLNLEYYPSEEPENLKAYLVWDDLSLPIKKGQRVGEINILENGKDVLLQGILVADNDVNKTLLQTVKDFFSSFFRKKKTSE